MRFLAWVGIILVLANLACALRWQDEPTQSIGQAGQITGGLGEQPLVQIISPASGQEALVGQAVEIRVLATHSLGVTNLQLNVGNRTGGSKSFPEPATSAEALLTWVPDREGTFELSVIAYRRTGPGESIVSQPATVSLRVLGRDDTARNPVSGQAAPPVVSGGECLGRVLIGNLRIRSGPGTDFQNMGNFQLNEQLSLIGRNADGSWYQIRRLDGSQNWAINNAEWLQVSGDCAALPTVN